MTGLTGKTTGTNVLYFSLRPSEAQLGSKSGVWYNLYLLILFSQTVELFLEVCPAKGEDILCQAGTSIDQSRSLSICLCGVMLYL